GGGGGGNAPVTEEVLPRVLALEGASNVRDLGGWPTSDGRRVRFGRVFRSAALTGLTERDIDVLAETGLRTVCDLRGTREAERAPYALDRLPGVTVRRLPIEPSVGASLRDLLATREATGEDVLTVMKRAYQAYALEWSHRYRAIFALLQDEAALPLLLHCSAGKDRTGFGAALILTALGVPYEAVREDYLASNRLWRGDAGLAAELPDPIAKQMLRVHRELLDAAFEAIEGAFGEFKRYAAVMLGVKGEGLRDRLTG
ncbi:MAG TPA: tyrosine-protein phosphatase, partial [Acetobacteraceae bacterium]|nr:tyrosine-protein phosphatase [Acetobacteraceae bacterium]